MIIPVVIELCGTVIVFLQVLMERPITLTIDYMAEMERLGLTIILGNEDLT